jgi:hypothetical protein
VPPNPFVCFHFVEKKKTKMAAKTELVETKVGSVGTASASDGEMKTRREKYVEYLKRRLSFAERMANPFTFFQSANQSFTATYLIQDTMNIQGAKEKLLQMYINIAFVSALILSVVVPSTIAALPDGALELQILDQTYTSKFQDFISVMYMISSEMFVMSTIGSIGGILIAGQLDSDASAAEISQSMGNWQKVPYLFFQFAAYAWASAFSVQVLIQLRTVTAFIVILVATAIILPIFLYYFIFQIQALLNWRISQGQACRPVHLSLADTEKLFEEYLAQVGESLVDKEQFYKYLEAPAKASESIQDAKLSHITKLRAKAVFDRRCKVLAEVAE